MENKTNTTIDPMDDVLPLTVNGEFVLVKRSVMGAISNLLGEFKSRRAALTAKKGKWHDATWVFAMRADDYQREVSGAYPPSTSGIRRTLDAVVHMLTDEERDYMLNTMGETHRIRHTYGDEKLMLDRLIKLGAVYTELLGKSPYKTLYAKNFTNMVNVLQEFKERNK